MRAVRDMPVGKRRRGTVLMAVLVVIVIAAMVGTTALYAADAEIATTRTTVRVTQSRALAWSAVQMAMAEVLAQRDTLLDGGQPQLTRDLVFPGGGSGAQAVARLVEIVPGQVAVPEAAKLDLNTATAEMLVATGLVGAPVAGRIVGAAAQRPLASVEELLGIEGITPEMIYGGASVGAGRADGVGRSGTSSEAASRLGDVLTAYAFDPNIQAGVGDRGSDHRGKKRINIASEWSDALGRAVSNRFGKDAAQVLEQVMKGGTRFAKASDLVTVLRRLNVPPEEWGPILDSFTTSDDDYLIGLVDLSSASAAVLSCVPGIGAEPAAQIVRERERLGADSRRSVVWPLTGGILSQEQFQTAVDHLTTRCMQWRVRVEAGYLKQPLTGERGAGTAENLSAPTGSEGADGRLFDRVVYEAVIDVASRRARVAYLRDVTMLPGAYAMYQAGAAHRTTEEVAPEASAPGSGEVAKKEDGRGSDLELDTDLNFGGLDFAGPGEKSREAGRGADPTVPADGSAPGAGRTSDTQDHAGAAASPAGNAGTPVDRRIGRWTTGARGGGGR